LKTLPLYAMAHARSGDKGDASNVGVRAYDDRGYAILREQLTPERVKAHFGALVAGPVERFEMETCVRSTSSCTTRWGAAARPA
jgi:hypothetical protein